MMIVWRRTVLMRDWATRVSMTYMRTPTRFLFTCCTNGRQKEKEDLVNFNGEDLYSSYNFAALHSHKNLSLNFFLKNG